MGWRWTALCRNTSRRRQSPCAWRRWVASQPCCCLWPPESWWRPKLGGLDGRDVALPGGQVPVVLAVVRPVNGPLLFVTDEDKMLSMCLQIAEDFLPILELLCLHRRHQDVLLGQLVALQLQILFYDPGDSCRVDTPLLGKDSDGRRGCHRDATLQAGHKPGRMNFVTSRLVGLALEPLACLPAVIHIVDRGLRVAERLLDGGGPMACTSECDNVKPLELFHRYFLTVSDATRLNQQLTSWRFKVKRCAGDSNWTSGLKVMSIFKKCRFMWRALYIYSIYNTYIYNIHPQSVLRLCCISFISSTPSLAVTATIFATMIIATTIVDHHHHSGSLPVHSMIHVAQWNMLHLRCTCMCLLSVLSG